MCINRNILECKLEIMMQVVVFRMRINRNILECKFLIFINILYHNQLVLIETYWNVNEYVTVDFSLTDTVLIETYWNVNKKDHPSAV